MPTSGEASIGHIIHAYVTDKRKLGVADPHLVSNFCNSEAEKVAASRWLIAWTIEILPVLGLIGTVVGIATALPGAVDIMLAGDSLERANKTGNMTSLLAVAFSTTFFAMVAAAVLGFWDRWQRRQEQKIFKSLEDAHIDWLLKPMTASTVEAKKSQVAGVHNDQ